MFLGTLLVIWTERIEKTSRISGTRGGRTLSVLWSSELQTLRVSLSDILKIC